MRQVLINCHKCKHAVTRNSLLILCIFNVLSTVACRGLVMPRATCLIVCPLPNSCFEQWRTVVIVTEYTFFVTSQYSNIFTFPSQHLARCVDTTYAYYATRTLLTRCCTMCHCNEHNYQRSNLGDQNKIEHSTLRQSSS